MPFAKTPGSWLGEYELARTGDDSAADKLHIQCPLDNRLGIGASAPARHSLGKLDQLPDELLCRILLFADIPSLTLFRRVNRRAMQIVNSIPQYDAIIRQCPDVIRAILATEANAFDLDHLHKTLKNDKCFSCSTNGSWGTSLYLITCRRVCTHCLLRCPEWLPCKLEDSAESEETRHQSHQMPEAKYPSILTLPFEYKDYTDLSDDGYYERPLDPIFRRRIRVFDREAVGQEAGYTPTRLGEDHAGCGVGCGWSKDLYLRMLAMLHDEFKLH